MKLKMIVLALGFVASAASQAVLVGPDNLGSSDMMLVVYDANQSYEKDLGFSYSQFLASTGNYSNTHSGVWATLTSSTSANWTNFLANVVDSTAVQYAVINGKTPNAAPNDAVLSTINAGSYSGVIGNFVSDDVTYARAQVSTYYSNLAFSGTMNTLAHGDSRNLAGTAGYYLTSHMDTFNGTLYTNSSAVGTSMAFERVQRNNNGLSDPTETLYGNAQNAVIFSQVGGNYVLAYPFPEASGYAMTLAGFGVIGFFGVRRKRA
ncbi:MAG: hypothetical protein H7306_24555 [Bacteriovorax sp.]|nr:hypothetical protein [Rhizobacter sp.]